MNVSFRESDVQLERGVRLLGGREVEIPSTHSSRAERLLRLESVYCVQDAAAGSGRNK